MKKWPYFLLASFIVLLDQITKYWAFVHLSPYQSVPVIPLMNWTLAYNAGAAFSFLNGAGAWSRWFFVFISLGMSGVFTTMLLRVAKTKRRMLLALSFLLGGAVGNLIDRAFFGYVIDFIDVYYKSHHWPVFNIADSFICIGALLLFFSME